MQLMPDSPLRRAALEVEAHVAAEGWDQSPRLFALVPTADLIAHEPALADQLSSEPGSITIDVLAISAATFSAEVPYLSNNRSA